MPDKPDPPDYAAREAAAIQTFAMSTFVDPATSPADREAARARLMGSTGLDWERCSLAEKLELWRILDKAFGEPFGVGAGDDLPRDARGQAQVMAIEAAVEACHAFIRCHRVWLETGAPWGMALRCFVCHRSCPNCSTVAVPAPELVVPRTANGEIDYQTLSVDQLDAIVTAPESADVDGDKARGIASRLGYKPPPPSAKEAGVFRDLQREAKTEVERVEGVRFTTGGSVTPGAMAEIADRYRR